MPSAASPWPLLVAPRLVILAFWGADIVILGARICNLACLVPPPWRLEGPWGDPGAPAAARKDTSGAHLSFSCSLDPGVFLHGRFQVSFSDDFWV